MKIWLNLRLIQKIKFNIKGLDSVSKKKYSTDLLIHKLPVYK